MNESEPLRILFSCSGLGMGNASRDVAILEELVSYAKKKGRRVECRIFSWGSGHRFLEAYLEQGQISFQLEKLASYPNGLARPGTILAFLKNTIALGAAILRFGPELIVLDSDYHFPVCFLARCPIVFVGQAFDVLDRAKRWGYSPGSLLEKWNFFAKEKLDAIAQCLFSRAVLVPTFSSDGSRRGKVEKIPLIVRREFNRSPTCAPEPGSVGIFLSGSGIERAPFEAFADENQLKIFGSRTEATFLSNAHAMDTCEIVIVQGGLSSISECLARGKFLVVVPISNHPEQILNAYEVEKMGRGLSANLSDLSSLASLREKIARKRAQFSERKEPAVHGAEVAAAYLFNFAVSSQTVSPR